jgi:prepilin signal peptidase PulO-like enzyme (type II secretory pathway)
MTTPWIMIAIVLLIIFFGVAAVVLNTKKRPPDYYNLFVIGLVWTAIGIPMENYVLSALGLIFLVTGLSHKKSWEKNRRSWGALDEKEKRLTFLVTGVLGALVFFGLIAYTIVK